ncbi:B3 domain-containing protein At1g49475 [Linum perenne]
MAEQEEADAGGMCFFKAGVPHFTLVLWFKPFREGKLRLPKGFTKEHGAELANEVLFKLPNGAEWQVSVVRGRKRIWFVKGWREFAEFYCLKPSNYLVFGLASRNSLNVLIFDTTLTATEIDYPNKKTNVIESEYDVASNEAVQRPSSSSPKATAKLSLKLHKLRRKNVEGRTASGEELDSNDKQGNTSLATESDSTCRPNKHDHSTKTRDKPSLGSIQPHKLRRTDGMDGTASSSKEGNYPVPGDVFVFELIKGEHEEDADAIGLKLTLFFRGAAMAEQEEADACGMWLYKVGVPRFALVLQLEPFSEGKLQLPEEFAEEHGAELANEVLLKLPNGAEWQVSVVRSGPKKIWFVKGWKEFAEFYSLKPTHFMLFELASHNRLNVIIFDTTATEIDYSNKKANVKVESECDFARDEAAQRRPPSSPSARAKPLKLRRKSVMGRTASGKQGRRFKDERRSFTHPRTANNRAIGALAKANVVFESENPFFMTVIQKTHLIPGHKLVDTFCFWLKSG